MDGSVRRYAWAVFSLLALALAPRLLAIAWGVSPNNDAIRYWSGADRFLTLPFAQALASLDSLPLYPMLLALLKGLGLGQTPEGWWRSSQALGLISYLVFLGTAFGVGCQFIGPVRAWWACAWISLLARQVRYSVDILADNLSSALLWIALAGWLHAFGTRGRPRVLAASSLVMGGAMLTRPESVLWWGILLLATVVRSIQLGSLPRTLLVSTLLWVVPAGGLVGLHLAIRGEVSPSNTSRALLGSITANERASAGTGGHRPSERTPLDAWMALPPVGLGESIRNGGVASCIALWELAQETRLVLLLFLLVGLGASRDRPWSSERWVFFGLLLGTWVMLTYCRWGAGFLAGRYWMPVLPIVAFSAVEGLEHLVNRWPRRSLELRGPMRVAYGVSAIVAVGLLVPSLWEPMHADRHGHRQAARWLMEHTQPTDTVFDPSWVSAFFSGRPMSVPSDPLQPRYAVLEEAMVADPPHGLASAMAWANQGELVAQFPRRPGSLRLGVRILRTHAPAPTETQPLARRENEQAR
jgi:hypothetical protein